MSLLALLSRPGFLCGSKKDIEPWNVCILLALPMVPQRCADWRATPSERSYWTTNNKANSNRFCSSVGTRD